MINLPQHILPKEHNADEDIIIYPYHAPIGSFREKSMLTSNAVSLVIRGEKTMFFAEKTVHVNDREIHFLSAGNCIAAMKFNPAYTIKSILIFFSDKVLADFYIKYDDKIQQLKTAAGTEHSFYVSIPKDKVIEHFISSLELLIASPGMLSTEMKQVKFEELMLHLLHTSPHLFLSFQPNSGRGHTDMTIRTVAENNITTNITIDELAFLCNMSAATFKRRFARMYNTSPARWIQEQRINMACRLLRHNGERPADVYHQVGYENHASFSHAFRQITGQTPTAYQKEQLIVSR